MLLRQNSWIVTLDVLKYGICQWVHKFCTGWIVTLDVLKYSNMDLTSTAVTSWIVTLDVLKYPHLLHTNLCCEVE